ncbi:hypothetical protein [Fischerella sp. PCC 9605]|nr:hypothetical protein [Fischerella sp. PCC 9605]
MAKTFATAKISEKSPFWLGYSSTELTLTAPLAEGFLLDGSI